MPLSERSTIESSLWPRVDRALPVVLAVAMFGFYGWHLISAGQVPPSTYMEGDQRIVFLDSEGAVAGAPFWVSFVIAILIIFGVAIRAIAAKRALVGWLLLVGLFSCPCVGVAGLLRMEDPVRYIGTDSLLGPDGVEYGLLQFHFMQASDLVIGRVRREKSNGKEFVVLAESPWESTFGYLSVVRPKRMVGKEKLVLTDAGLLVGVVQENKAYLAWDMRTGKAHHDDGMATTFSPFVLIRPDDELVESDFETLMEEGSSLHATAETVQRDFENPNPRVRELARKLYAHLKKYPRP